MKTKILVTAVGTALALGPALRARADVKLYGADVKLYGSAQIEAAQVKNDGADPAIAFGVGNGQNQLSVTDNARGRIGIAASEDVGGGLKGIAGFEYQTNTATAGPPASRQAYVGLASDSWGTIEGGSLESPYKYTGGVDYDPFVDTTLEARSNGGMSGLDVGASASGPGFASPAAQGGTGVFGQYGFIRNAVAYLSPSLAGVKLWALYSAGHGADPQGASGDYAGAIAYDGKVGATGYQVFVAADRDASIDLKAYKAGAQVRFLGVSTVSLQYERVENPFGDAGVDPASGGGHAQYWFAGYQLAFPGNNTFAAQLGQAQYASGGTAPIDGKSKYYAVGVIHNFSPTLRTFVGYRMSDLSELNAGTVQVLSLGLRKDF